MKNTARLKEMEVRWKILDEFHKGARLQIIEDMKCYSTYGNILNLLLIEGLYKVRTKYD